ncbi:ribosome biogenesis GTPase Der [Frigoriglobus tundricola]|uniref:GTPase Der n=1 Tax=Frigoriglobus tundricola TaxID=2774151 RepID=A0A6M5YUP1_9BACT|nr:ribosome biogenesis GTPase Der [Frigoriglobus tundricola]QJW97785.1 GTP-binding protein EngA [Frigoriglobus tundricola]
MSLPIVAIVGRPNVGKSSLFNWLAGRRISIVDPTAGVTRDRVSTVVEHGGRAWELMDTGGIGIVDVDDLSADVERQIQIAIDQAAVVVFVVDVREGIVPLDEDVSARLRAIKKPVVLVANKADTDKLAQQGGEFCKFGYGEPLCVSADQKLGKDELFDAIFEKLPDDTGELAPEEAALKIAIVGRRNAGKSTFINSLAGADRVIVSEIPGTTRDSVDVRFDRDGKSYIAIDTAGVRKKAMVGTNIEFYSLHRAQRSIRRADVVLHFFDARHRVSRVDKQLAQYIVEENKPAIFVVNKWDLVKESMDTEKMGEYVRLMFPMLEHVPIAFITAKQGKNVLRLLQLAVQLHKQAGIRVTTGDLNRTVQAAIEANHPPMAGSRQPKVFYATQIGVHPPTIVLFTNGPELFDETYVRYLTKVLRDTFPFSEVAIKVVLRAKGEGGRRAPDEEPIDGVPVDDGGDEAPIVRAPRRQPLPAPPPPVVTDPEPRPRKKPRGSETWDF